jgi:hypothetical protein
VKTVSRSTFGFVATVVTVVFASPAAAQRVSGRLTDIGSGQPVAFGVIEVLDSAGLTLQRTQSTADGLFLTRITSGTAVRLRATAIGYSTELTGFLHLQSTESKQINIALRVQALDLPEIGSSSRRTCSINGAASTVLTVWTEARKALRGTVLGEQERLFTFEGYLFMRKVTQDSVVLTQKARPLRAGTSQPFVAPPLASLVAEGYIQRRGPSYVYYAPNAAVLLSPDFEDGHCFSLVRNAERPELVGVAFSPARTASKNPGISGTAWLDVRSGALRLIDFRYVNAPTVPYSEYASGTVEFRVIPGAGWVVNKWKIVTPVTAIETRYRGRSAGTMHVTEFIHDGGELTAVTAGGVHTVLAPPGSISGTAYDSTRFAPLGRAVITLQGTGLTTHTDAFGRYRFDDVQPGSYMLTLYHSRLDSLPAYDVLGTKATVLQGKEAVSAVAIPPLERSMLHRCVRRLAAEDEGGIMYVPAFGIVRDSVSGARLAGATVKFDWQRLMATRETLRTGHEDVETSADERGRFIVCNVPDERWIDIVVSTTDAAYAPVRRLSTTTPTFWDVRVTRRVIASPVKQ